MANPGGFTPGAGEDWIGRKFAQLEGELRELRAANVFGRTGITPKDGGTDFDGYVNVNGPMSITGALNLPAGIIGNDALTSPLFPKTAHADVADFALNTGPNAEMVRATVLVPEGYTRALVMASASMGNRNPSATSDDMYIDCRINGAVSGWSSQTAVVAGKSGFVVNLGTALLEELSGSFYIAANASSGLAPWPANSAAAINVDAIILFLR